MSLPRTMLRKSIGLHDGICNENVPQFRHGKTVEMMWAIDPDIVLEKVESSEDVDPPVPAVAEAAGLGAQPTPVEVGELISNCRAPSDWGRDDFPPKGPVR